MVDREATCQWLVKLANILGKEEKTGDEITFRNLKAFHSHILDVMALLLDLPKEPRVMTLEEVKTLPDGTDVWLDEICCSTIACTVAKPELFHKTDNGMCRLPSITEKAMFYGVEEEFLFADYGKVWRCWTSRPTEDQTWEVAWDE